jgi:hypothetical protein
MMALEISGGLMLLFGGLWTGAVLLVAFERTSIWQLMPLEQYAVDFRRSLFRSGPVLTVLGLGAAIPAVVFAVHSTGYARDMAASGVGGFALIVITSIVFAAPVESRFRRSAEGYVPERAAVYRIFWRRFHFGRTLVAVVVFGAFIAAAVHVDWTPPPVEHSNAIGNAP